MVLIRIKEASEYIGLHPHTLRKYVDDGLIKGVLIGNHRFVDRKELDRVAGMPAQEQPEADTTVIYAQVSTKKQEVNLDRQRQRLFQYCIEHKLNVVEVIDDIASGVNERRKGLQKLLHVIRTKQVKNVLIEYKDRLARFGITYLQEIFATYGVHLIIVNQENHSPEEELVQDLLAIVTSFSARIYGRRGARRIIKTIQEETKARA